MSKRVIIEVLVLTSDIDSSFCCLHSSHTKPLEKLLKASFKQKKSWIEPEQACFNLRQKSFFIIACSKEEELNPDLIIQLVDNLNAVITLTQTKFPPNLMYLPV